MKRDGFTLIEVLLALVMLTIVCVGMAKFVGTFIHTVSTSTTKTVATEVALQQLELIQADPQYPLPASYVVSTTGFAGYPAMNRTTVFLRNGGPTYTTKDYTVVTVRVTEPTMRDTVNVTAVVARP